MSQRSSLIRTLQAIAAEEAARQPPAADWLWAQDHCGDATINADDPDEVAFWARVLNASALEIARAIASVGGSALAVRQRLDK